MKDLKCEANQTQASHNFEARNGELILSDVTCITNLAPIKEFIKQGHQVFAQAIRSRFRLQQTIMTFWFYI